MKIPPFIIDALPDYRALRRGYEFLDPNATGIPRDTKDFAQTVEKLIQDLVDLGEKDENNNP